jgi:hypothetical protein
MSGELHKNTSFFFSVDVESKRPQRSHSAAIELFSYYNAATRVFLLSPTLIRHPPSHVQLSPHVSGRCSPFDMSLISWMSREYSWLNVRERTVLRLLSRI